MSATIKCPHCREAAAVRTSRAVTRTYRQLHLQCRNTSCGHTFGAELTITHTISPSACPDPEIHLRQAAQRRSADNDNRGGPEVPLVAANDVDTSPSVDRA